MRHGSDMRSPQTSLTFQQHKVSSTGPSHSFCGESDMPRRSPMFHLEDTDVTKWSWEPIPYNKKTDVYSFNSFYKDEPSISLGSGTYGHRWFCSVAKIESRGVFSHAYGGDGIFDSCLAGPCLLSGVPSASWGKRVLHKHTCSGSQRVCKEKLCSGMGPNCHLWGRGGGSSQQAGCLRPQKIAGKQT